MALQGTVYTFKPTPTSLATPLQVRVRGLAGDRERRPAASARLRRRHALPPRRAAPRRRAASHQRGLPLLCTYLLGARPRGQAQPALLAEGYSSV